MTKKIKQPDPKKHLELSIVKSVLRIIAGAAMFGITPVTQAVAFAGIALIFAEVIGIAEELV